MCAGVYRKPLVTVNDHLDNRLAHRIVGSTLGSADNRPRPPLSNEGPGGGIVSMEGPARRLTNQQIRETSRVQPTGGTRARLQAKDEHGSRSILGTVAQRLVRGAGRRPPLVPGAGRRPPLVRGADFSPAIRHSSAALWLISSSWWASRRCRRAGGSGSSCASARCRRPTRCGAVMWCPGRTGSSSGARGLRRRGAMNPARLRHEPGPAAGSDRVARPRADRGARF